jgi:hypothetical protein
MTKQVVHTQKKMILTFLGAVTLTITTLRHNATQYNNKAYSTECPNSANYGGCR